VGDIDVMGNKRSEKRPEGRRRSNAWAKQAGQIDVMGNQRFKKCPEDRPGVSWEARGENKKYKGPEGRQGRILCTRHLGRIRRVRTLIASKYDISERRDGHNYT
jgi:hypothetical protein